MDSLELIFIQTKNCKEQRKSNCSTQKKCWWLLVEKKLLFAKKENKFLNLIASVINVHVNFKLKIFREITY